MTGNPFQWPADQMSPYVHWWQEVGNSGFLDRGEIVRDDKSVPLSGVPEKAPGLARMRQGMSPYFGADVAVPMPGAVANPDTLYPEDWTPDTLGARVPRVPRDAVITAVIDEGIALGHPRFRAADGRTRVLASWQQGATFDASQATYLPFGQELYAEDIDHLLTQHSDGGDLTRALDETGFNRAARLDEPTQPHGVRAGSRRLSHGTAVLDLAAGADARGMDPDALARRPIIAVNLPRRSTIGMAGTFLEFYSIYALNRIVALADQIWREQHGGKGGFPIVVNLSYGQQAGPKDGHSPFEVEIARLQRSRPDGAPLEVVMPAGNDNLMRCHARKKMRPGKESFDEHWRIQPEDHSSNFVEVWTEASSDGDPTHPLEIRVQSPEGEAVSHWRGQHGQAIDIGADARIYCQQLNRNGQDGERSKFRFRYVICVPPTADDARATGTGRKASAGLWHIHLQGQTRPGHVYMNVQVDQSAEPDGERSRRSYFDNAGYRKYRDSGRLRDTFEYPLRDPDDVSTSNLEPWDRSHVQRKGTINSIAVHWGILTVGSYRASDGRPSPFSATGYWPPYAPHKNGPALDIALPADESPTQRGIWAAGTSAGSVDRFRGTSFSAASATRLVVDRILAALDAGKPPGRVVDRIKSQAAGMEARLPETWGAAARDKIGLGRFPSPG